MLTIFGYQKHFVEHGTKDQILAGLGDWHTVIERIKRSNNTELRRFDKGMDEKARALAQIDQRLADLYLSCIFVDIHRFRSY